MPPFTAQSMDDLPGYKKKKKTQLAGINRKNQNVNAYNRKLQGL